MKTVYSAADPIMGGFVEQVLRDAGIPAFCFQGGLVGAAGEIPPTECYGRVVVVHPEHAEQARTIVREYLEGEPPTGDGWQCPNCGECCDEQFTACWACETERPIDASTD